MESSPQIEGLERQLEHVLRRDEVWCARKLQAARARARRGEPVDIILAKVAERVRESTDRRARRANLAPQPVFDGSLPIHSHRGEIIAAIQAHPVLILAGETGSGKTTQLPKMCLEAGRGQRGLIGCTQPRRIAARAMAERVAEELATPMGGAVGYQVRFREQIGPDSLIKFMTDGILLAETATDRDLDAYDTLVIDEAHERSLNIDFLLGYLKQLLSRRPDLRVIITSATIDTDKFSAHFDDAPVIEVSGRSYPVDVIYQPVTEEDDDRGSDRRNLYRGIAEAVGRLSRIDPRGDILVFLSGEREIREAMKYLGRQSLRHTEILPLYARLSGAEQRRVFHPGPQRRIVLSTNVAETSLTVPRIRFVIDSGLARISRYSHRSRIQRLPIEAVSQASANQRAGRCGRLGPGTCVRLYDEEDFQQRPEFTEPEILRTSLASVILRMLTMNLGAVEEFPFVDPPAPRMITDAYQLLFELGAVDGDRTPTRLGRRLAEWPLDVRLARMVEEGGQQGCLEDVLVLASALSIQDPRERPLEAQQAADTAHERFADSRSDFVALLKLWQHLRAGRREHTGNQFRKLCRREYLNWQRVLEWFDLYQQLRDQAREHRMPLQGKHGSYAELHLAILSGLLSQIGQRDPEDPSYVGARGRRFHIFPGSGLFGRVPRWLMSAEIVETTRPYARINAQIEPDWVEQLAGHLLSRQHFEPHWSRRRGEVMAYEQVSLFGLVLIERRRVRFAPVHPEEARRIFIREALVGGELDQDFPFMRANAELRAELETAEHKRRSRDVLVGDEDLERLLDERLPANVCSSRSLREWLKKAGPGAERALRFDAADLLRDDAPEPTPDDWPDEVGAGGHRWPLSYLFRPGDPADGVTVTVPLELLNRLEPGRLQWLVPGLLPEKVVGLIKTLPKPLRRVLTPAPHHAQQALERLGAGRDQSLLEALAGVLSDLAGVPIGADEFDEAALPDHLRMRVLVRDSDGRVVAESRDLEGLQEKLGGHARRRFMDQQGEGWNRDGETEWVFGKLPTCVVAAQGTKAWPALVDQSDAVGLRLFDSAEEAALAHFDGVLRLVSLAVAGKLRYLEKNHGLSRVACLAWAPFGPLAPLIRDLAQLSLTATAGEDAPAVRDDGRFTRLVDRVRQELGRVFQGFAATLEEILLLAGEISLALNDDLARTRPKAFRDMQSQLHDLLYEGFLQDLPPDRLQHYPRYLRAMRIRLERLDLNPARDERQRKALAPWWQHYLDHLAAGGLYDETLDRYRWLLEEYRVSLFAQQLGTREKVSPERLKEAWTAIDR